ncbi:MAG: hypothetical protein OXC48_11490 [Endozoicomonadaceae bacterium]|nr:hypothetical protein [Endozoicomonadaceae bacterium]
MRTLSGHEKAVTKVIELEDGCLASCSYDDTMKVWDLIKPDGEECVRTLKGHERYIYDFVQQED